jgi:hypothetical protein
MKTRKTLIHIVRATNMGHFLWTSEKTQTYPIAKRLKMGTPEPSKE